MQIQSNIENNDYRHVMVVRVDSGLSAELAPVLQVRVKQCRSSSLPYTASSHWLFYHLIGGALACNRVCSFWLLLRRSAYAACLIGNTFLSKPYAFGNRLLDPLSVKYYFHLHKNAIKTSHHFRQVNYSEDMSKVVISTCSDEYHTVHFMLLCFSHFCYELR